MVIRESVNGQISIEYNVNNCYSVGDMTLILFNRLPGNDRTKKIINACFDPFSNYQQFTVEQGLDTYQFEIIV